jgi:hypothetical protein
MKKIATIRTKFDFSKSWEQAANYPLFLIDHKEEWEEVLKEVTEEEINEALEEEGQEGRIVVEDIESHEGSILITASIFSNPIIQAIAITVIGNLLSKLLELFAKRLNKKVREVWEYIHPLSQLPEEVIEVDDFEITPE